MLQKRQFFFGIISLLLCKLIFAQEPFIDVHNKATLQRGAKLYMNYCSGCHSLKYIRYNRMAEDLLKNNRLFTEAFINDPIRIALPPEDAQQWFGIVPPDLSLITRQQGALWVYQYLKSFYSDDARPFGVNNLLVPGVIMPNILEPLFGQLSESQSNQLLQDLVTFLVYVGDPEQTIRYRIGYFVLIFLGVFLFAALRLKKLYCNNGVPGG